MRLEEIVSDADLKKAFGHANFGNTTEREVIKFALLKANCGYHNGHTADCIIKELGLINEKRKLLKKGKEYLFWSFYEGNH